MKLNRYLFPAIKAGFFVSIVFVLVLSACAPAASPVEEPAPAVEAEPAATAAPVEEEPAAPEAEPTAEEVSVEEPAEEPEEAPEPEFLPVKFVDALGRGIVIERPPLRIVSLAPSITESLFGIGAGDLVVGRTDYCDYPPEAEAIPSIGGFSASTISVETIISLEPDLVIGGAARQAEIIEALDAAGIAAFVLENDTVPGTMETLQLLGFITDHDVETSELLAEMQSRIVSVVETAAAIPEEERVTVFYEVWHEPLMTTTSQTFIGQMIDLAGGKNVFGELEEEYPSISAEQIIDYDPQVILGPSSHGDQLTVEMISAREGWTEMTAVQNEAIYIIEGTVISHTGPRIVDALDLIAAALYPDYFGDEN